MNFKIIFNCLKTSLWPTLFTWLILGLDLSNVLFFLLYVLVNALALLLRHYFIKWLESVQTWAQNAINSINGVSNKDVEKDVDKLIKDLEAEKK